MRNNITIVNMPTLSFCSFFSSYAIVVDLHITPRGILQVNSGSGLDNLYFWSNHAHDTKWQSESSGLMDTHTHVRNKYNVVGQTIYLSNRNHIYIIWYQNVSVVYCSPYFKHFKVWVPGPSLGPGECSLGPWVSDAWLVGWFYLMCRICWVEF